MKKNLVFITFATAVLLGLTGCGGNSGGGGGGTTKKFSFDISLDSGRDGILYFHEDGTSGSDLYRIKETNPDPSATYTYSYEMFADDGIVISDYVTAKLASDVKGQYVELTPVKPTVTDEGGEFWITIAVSEASVRRPVTKNFKIVSYAVAESGGRNFSSDTTAKQTILGKLEEYAMDNYLTGITLFENGGYVRFSDRVKLATQQYITGYGWGLLAEGRLEGSISKPDPNYPNYLHTATSSDPQSINAWDATGSQVSDLNSYISGSYWSTRMKGTNAYEWYPSLAQDKIINGDGIEVPFNEPIPAPDSKGNAKLGLYNKWRIFVKTDETYEATGTKTWGGIQYRTASSKKASFNNRSVKLEDYEFVFQMLLSQESKLTRGAELAGDTSYGIKGGASFYRKSKDHTDNTYLDNLWNQMKESGELGIGTGVDPVNGPYIDLELINPVDSFTAMYTLSSNLYTPIPKDFISGLGGGKYTSGALMFGSFPSASENVIDYTLCLGPFYLQKWSLETETVFARNNSWYETEPAGGDRYHIEGVYMRVVSQATQIDSAIYDHFMNGELDQTGIPASVIKKGEGGEGIDKKSGGNSTFKLNVNSCTKEEWNELNDKIWKNDTIDSEWGGVKPWMSNKNFLKGLHWSIDRAKFAKARGVNPSVNYFSGSYLSDPKKGISYNESAEHAHAIRNFHNTWVDEEGNTQDDYGYDLATAKKAFKAAVDELVESGDIKLPSTIKIHIRWMYESDIRDYGNEIGGYIKTAFEDPSVSNGQVKIDIVQDAVKQWDHVYTKYLMKGQFDLGFGAISGNTYNPLNFLEVLKSDNSSGFTLNWGTDTSEIDELNPIIYNGKAWSFDALWAAADHGTIVDEGKDVDPVENCYKINTTQSRDNLYEGGTFDMAFNFVELKDAESAEFNVTSVQLYLDGYGTYSLEGESVLVKEGNVYHIYISEAMGEEINRLIVEGLGLDEEAAKDKYTDAEKFELLHPFTLQKYNLRWNIEVHYTMTINKGLANESITESTTYCFANKTEQDESKKK